MTKKHKFLPLLATLLCTALVLLCACGQTGTQTAVQASTQELTIPGARGTIPATLTVPEGAENMPAVVLCHGFTGDRTLDGHTAPLAQALAQKGIASIAIDFAGNGESTEPFTAYTMESMQSDIASAIDYLTGTVGADPERIGLLGHSMGGRAVVMSLSDSVKAAALWAPATNIALDGLEFLDQSIEGRQAIYDEAKANGSVEMSKWGVTISRELIEQVVDNNPTDSLRNYKGALLLAYTAQDTELLSQNTIDLTTQAAEDRGVDFTNLTGQFTDATHNFTALSGDEAEDQAVRARIEDATVEFFAANL